MVSKVFGIYGDDLNACSLLIETGPDYIACCKHNDNHQLKAFELFNFGEKDSADFYKLFSSIQLESRLLSETAGTVELVWSNEKALCVPKIYFSGELVPSLLEIMHGITGEIRYAVSEFEDMVIVGYIPVNAAEVYSGLFNVSNNHHKYYSLLDAQRQDDRNQSVYIVFTPGNFTYSVYKENKLQVIQSRAYETTDDMLYHLLNALNVFNMEATNADIIVSGMIDESSLLYKCLYTHFKHFRFLESEKANFAAEGFHKYPLHYFASFCQ